MFSRSRVLSHLQTGLLLATVLLFVSPIELPDPLALGPQLSWALVCLAVSCAICVTQLIAGRWPGTKLDGLMAAFVVLVGVSAVASVDRGETAKAMVLLAAEVGMFYAAAAVTRRDPRVSAQVLIILVIGSAVVELVALAYHLEIGLGARTKEYASPAGWSGYPELGALGVLQLGVLLGALITSVRGVRRAGVAALTVIAALELLFLYSRGAWAAAAIMGLAALPFLGGSRKQRAMVLGGAVAAAIVLLVANPTIRFLASNALTGTLDAPANAAGIEVASPESRLKLWRESTSLIRDHPLFGVGLGNFRTVFESVYNPELNDDSRRGVHAHNLWLHTTADVGVPGGLCFLALWGAALWLAARAAWRRRNAVSIGLFLALVGATASNLTDNVPAQIRGLRVFLMMWVLLGVAAGESADALIYAPAPASSVAPLPLARLRQWARLLPRYWWIPLMFIVLLARRPDAFTTPQFWAEDSVVFHAGAERDGLRSLVRPVAGYQLLLPRVVALATTTLVDARWQPAAFNYAAVVMILLVCASLGVRRWDGPPGLLCALALVMSWQADEILISLTNTQWVLMLAIVVCCVIRPPVTSRGQWLEAAALLLVGLTGPFAVVLWPLALARAWAHRKAALPSFLALSVAAAIQLIALSLHGAEPPPPGLTREPWTRILALRVFAQPFLPRSFWPASAGWQHVVGAVGVIVVAIAGLYPGPRHRMRIMLLLAAILVQTAAVVRMNAARDLLILGPDLAPRYFFDARVLIVWLLLAMTTGAFPKVLKGVAIACVAAYFITAALSFRIAPLPDLRWPQYAPAVSEGRPIYIPVNPVPWVYHYAGRKAQ